MKHRVEALSAPGLISLQISTSRGGALEKASVPFKLFLLVKFRYHVDALIADGAGLPAIPMGCRHWQVYISSAVSEMISSIDKSDVTLKMLTSATNER